MKNIKLYFLFLLLFSFNLFAFENQIIIASTTSTSDTGLLEYLNKNFEKLFKIKVKVLSLGTGQAIRTAKDGNVEILLVHHTISEHKFIEDGFGLIRYNLMYNDYLIIGPKKDIKICTSIEKKLKDIISYNLTFISRGDDSGTHKKELELWNSINLNPQNFNKLFYLNVGQGMGNTLLIANEKSAYTISDRGTWISFKKKNNLKIICESKPPLFNQYGLILVNPIINDKLNIESAKIYIKWLISDEGKKLINDFKKNEKQLFFFNYK